MGGRLSKTTKLVDFAVYPKYFLFLIRYDSLKTEVVVSGAGLYLTSSA